MLHSGGILDGRLLPADGRRQSENRGLRAHVLPTGIDRVGRRRLLQHHQLPLCEARGNVVASVAVDDQCLVLPLASLVFPPHLLLLRSGAAAENWQLLDRLSRVLMAIDD